MRNNKELCIKASELIEAGMPMSRVQTTLGVSRNWLMAQPGLYQQAKTYFDRRNTDIKKAYQSGRTIEQLAQDYKLTTASIRQVVDIISDKRDYLQSIRHEILARFKTGLTVTQISRKFGVTYWAVANLPEIKELLDDRKNNGLAVYQQDTKNRVYRTLEAIKNNPGKTSTDLAAVLGVEPKRIRRVICHAVCSKYLESSCVGPVSRVNLTTYVITPTGLQRMQTLANIEAKKKLRVSPVIRPSKRKQASELKHSKLYQRNLEKQTLLAEKEAKAMLIDLPVRRNIRKFESTDTVNSPMSSIFRFADVCKEEEETV